MSYNRSPDRLSGPMSRGQAATLRTLSVEAYQPKKNCLRKIWPERKLTDASRRYSRKLRWQIHF